MIYYLFFYHNFFTAEHDIPYQQRSLVDLAAEGKTWMFDSSNQKTNLKVLVYDIETTKFEPGRVNIPIDIIGYSDFNIEFQSEKNLETEEFSFDILSCPTSWEDMDIKQLVDIYDGSQNILKMISRCLENQSNIKEYEDYLHNCFYFNDGKSVARIFRFLSTL